MDSDVDTDTIIGLDVRGKIFYCNKSKLLNANNGNSYFSARFREDSMLDAGLDRVDNEGRNIYKLDHDQTVFQYIMEYIDTAEKPIGIGTYEMNKQLWGLVREEALYFGLDHLVQLLSIAFSCSPQVDKGLGASGKGIMHWLGTKKGTEDYVNPYSSGAVKISGWFEGDENGREWNIKEKDKELMVQYMPNPEGEKSVGCENSGAFGSIFSGSLGALMGCGSLRWKRTGPLNFHLKGIAVSPTHYSIRNGNCYGMAGDWNLEASVDGENWDVIHESRGRSPLYDGTRDPERQQLWDRVKEYKGEERRDAICDYMEENKRHTWKVVNTSGKFYSYFRFVSVMVTYEEVEDDVFEWRDRRHICLHGIGFEVYGDVYKEWENESKTYSELQHAKETAQDRMLEVENDALTQNEMQQAQIKDLTDQNEKLQAHNQTLLSEVESLKVKARVRQLENKRSAEEACLLEDG